MLLNRKLQLMGLIKFITLGFMTLVFICNCTNGSNYSFEAANTRILRQEEQIEELKRTINKIEQRLINSESQLRDLDYSIGYFNADSEGYQRVDSNIGFFFISIVKLKPYGDGYKMTFNIGNPQMADFSDLILKIKWGKRFVTGKTSFLDHLKSMQSKEIRLIEKIIPGSWNPIEVKIGPASKEEIGSIEVSLATEGVSVSFRR